MKRTARQGARGSLAGMGVHVVFVHGIRTSATMWRAQLEYLRERGVKATAVDLPGHGTRRGETFTLDEAIATIDRAVRAAAVHSRVLIVGHSMGGILSTHYAAAAPPIAGFVAISCTAEPRGLGLTLYRLIIGAARVLPDRGHWFNEKIYDLTLPRETRHDFGAGGFADEMQDTALRSLAPIDMQADVARITAPLWFLNGQFDQLRIAERRFLRLAPHAELIVVPRASHLVTVMYPAVTNALLGVAVATVAAAE